MRYSVIFTVGLSLTFAAALAIADQTADEAAIRKANEGRITVWNAKDENGYPAFVHNGCTSGFDGTPCAAGAFPEEWKNAKIKVVEGEGDRFYHSRNRRLPLYPRGLWFF